MAHVSKHVNTFAMDMELIIINKTKSLVTVCYTRKMNLIMLLCNNNQKTCISSSWNSFMQPSFELDCDMLHVMCFLFWSSGLALKQVHPFHTKLCVNCDAKLFGSAGGSLEAHS